MVKGGSRGEKKQDSRELEGKCWRYLQPSLEQLHGLVDRRIVKISGFGDGHLDASLSE
jgi:hypothetical protein